MVISGGVACYAGVRLAAQQARLPYAVFFPTPALSTDNAAMIAAAAYPKFVAGQFDDFTLKASAGLTLA
jgi:N6-L-threonylcarbamoyladenine synthase